MVFQSILVAPGNHQDVMEPSIHGFLHHILNGWFIHHRKHFFGHGLRGRQKPGPQPCGGITALEIGTCLSYKAPYTWGMTEGGQPSKRALRAELRERRRIMTTLERSAAAEGLFTQLVELTKRFDATRIACYLSTGDEPTTRNFLEWAHQHAITAILPVSREDGLMDWIPFTPGSESLDSAGMPTPVGETLGPIALAEVDVIFCSCRRGVLKRDASGLGARVLRPGIGFTQ